MEHWVRLIALDLIRYFTDATLNGGAFLLGNIGMTRLKAVIICLSSQKYSETISNPKLFALDGKRQQLLKVTNY